MRCAAAASLPAGDWSACCPPGVFVASRASNTTLNFGAHRCRPGMEHAHKWFASHPVGSDKTLEELGAVISELRSAHGIEHVVTEGFCWGGGYAAALAATDKVGGVHLSA